MNYNITKRNRRTLGDIIYISLCSVIVSSLVSITLPKVISLIPQHIVYAYTNKPLISPTPIPTPTPVPTPIDQRVVALQKFLFIKNSPLEDYAQYIISESDKFGIAWTQIVAIAGIESDYGKKTPDGAHNAWGIGGDKMIYFPSWQDGIAYMSWLLGTKYRLSEEKAIKSTYCPSTDGCNSQWADIVTKNSEEILGL